MNVENAHKTSEDNVTAQSCCCPSNQMRVVATQHIICPVCGKANPTTNGICYYCSNYLPNLKEDETE